MKPVDDRTVHPVRTSSDHPSWSPIWGMRIARWSGSHPQTAVRYVPAGDRAVYCLAARTEISGWWPTGCHAVIGRQPAGDLPTSDFAWTSADHPPNFNSELKCLGRHPTSKGWALQECLFGWRRPDFCWIWGKSPPRDHRAMDFSQLGWQLYAFFSSIIAICLQYR